MSLLSLYHFFGPKFIDQVPLKGDAECCPNLIDQGHPLHENLVQWEYPSLFHRLSSLNSWWSSARMSSLVGSSLSSFMSRCLKCHGPIWPSNLPTQNAFVLPHPIQWLFLLCYEGAFQSLRQPTRFLFPFLWGVIVILRWLCLQQACCPAHLSHVCKILEPLWENYGPVYPTPWR